jgi:hypothetical protein
MSLHITNDEKERRLPPPAFHHRPNLSVCWEVGTILVSVLRTLALRQSLVGGGEVGVDCGGGIWRCRPHPSTTFFCNIRLFSAADAEPCRAADYTQFPKSFKPWRCNPSAPTPPAPLPQSGASPGRRSTRFPPIPPIPPRASAESADRSSVPSHRTRFRPGES